MQWNRKFRKRLGPHKAHKRGYYVLSKQHPILGYVCLHRASRAPHLGYATAIDITFPEPETAAVSPLSFQPARVEAVVCESEVA
jgi:hypothetical protein